MVWEPKMCCCGASIRVGTLIIGWLSLIGSVLHVLSTLRFAPFTMEDYRQMCTAYQGPQNSFDRTQNSFDHGPPSIINPEACSHIVISSIAINGVTATISIIISILLLVGIEKRRPMMMIPYMIFQVLGIILVGILGLIGFIVLMVFNLVGLGIFIAIIVGLVMFLQVYFFLIVRVCYKELDHHVSAMGGDSSIPYVEQVSMPNKI